MNAPTPVQALRAELLRRHPGLELDVYRGGLDGIHLSRIVVPKASRKQGIGAAVMCELCDFADARRLRITLTPSTDFGATSRSRLERFYGRFGFVMNRGRQKDFTTMEAMLRPAKPATHLSAQEPASMRAVDQRTVLTATLPEPPNAVSDRLVSEAESARSALRALARSGQRKPMKSRQHE